MRFLIILFLVALPSQAFAQEEDMLCTLLSIYKPADDVAYQEGVDVNGNAVVPADLNAADIELPAAIKIPLQINMAKRLESLMAINIDADAQLGLLEVYENGRVSYNGKNITNSASAACGLSHKVEIKKEVSSEAIRNDEAVIEDNVKEKISYDVPQTNAPASVDTIESETNNMPTPKELSVDKERDLLYGEEHKELN